MCESKFYPISNTVIEKMLQFYGSLENRIILVPSAGNGELLDFIADKKHSKDNLYAIEHNDEFIFLLQEKNYRLLAKDFLSYLPVHAFDMIIMNPPIDSAEDHLLQAWSILKGGDIVCLVNIDKVMCYLSGMSFEDMDTIKDEFKYYYDSAPKHYRSDIPLNHLKNLKIGTVIQKIEVGDSNKYESQFFKIRCFKKGTVHLEFKDENLWTKFNIAATEGKKMIGSGK